MQPGAIDKYRGTRKGHASQSQLQDAGALLVQSCSAGRWAAARALDIWAHKALHCCRWHHRLHSLTALALMMQPHMQPVSSM